MTRKRLLWGFLAVFVVIELIAVFVGVWSLPSTDETPSLLEDKILRLGILPVISKKASEELWTPFLQELRDEHQITIEPYFANAGEEIIAGFKNDVLDVLFVNSAIYLKLKDESDNLRVLGYQRDVGRREGDVAALVTLGDRPRFISKTENMSITFTNKHSVTGYIAPYAQLSQKLPRPPEKWFSKISFAGTDHQAVLDLMQGKTDIIAVEYNTLKEIMKSNNFQESDLRVMWLMRNLPPMVVCINDNLNKTFQDALRNCLLIDPTNPRSYAGKSIVFIPEDFVYQAQLDVLKKFLAASDATPP